MSERDVHRLRYDHMALRNFLEKLAWLLAYKVPARQSCKEFIWSITILAALL